MFPNSSNPHNLIPSENTYICDKHFVSFHSNDRDISKWPETSHFELNLPREMRGVETQLKKKILKMVTKRKQYSMKSKLKNTLSTRNLFRNKLLK